MHTNKQGWVPECFLLLFISYVFSTPQAQIDALEEFYTATNGNDWIDNSRWGVGDPCTNNWVGVGCIGGEVVQLYLIDNGLYGVLTDSLMVLPLQRL